MPDEIIPTPPPGEQKCDFCLSPDPVRTYPVETFTLDGLDFGSEGDWMACSACATAVQNEDRPQLVERHVQSLKARMLGDLSPQAEADERRVIGQVVDAFFEHRIPAKPL